MRPARDRRHVVDRAQGVGGIADGHDLGALIQEIPQSGHVQRVILDVEVDPAHGRAAVLGHHDPGRDVGVVVHAGDDDLVAGSDLTAQRAADAKRERRHVRAEHDFLRRSGVQHVGDGLVRIVQHGVAALAGGERAAVVGVAVGQVVADGVDHRLRHLGAAGVVEKHGRLAVDLHGESGILRTNLSQIKRVCHRSAFLGREL